MATNSRGHGSMKVYRFDIVMVSDEFLAVIDDIPEASTAKSVEIGGKRIEGAKEVLVCRSMEEVGRALPAIVAGLTDPAHQHVLIVQRIGFCSECADSDKLCPHFDQIPTMRQLFEVDTSELAKAGAK